MSTKVTGNAPLFQVFDMPTSVAFYCDVIGFTLVQRSQEGEAHFDWCMLKLDGAHLMLNTAYEQHERPPVPVPARVAHHDDVSLYFSVPDVAAVHRRFLAKGLNVPPPKAMHYGALEFTVKDPDGFNLSFQQF